ncbi:MAG: tRNA uridine-5-carboxymethylaminomethyl(34) synthesis GTPase MnmE [Candidatus Dasytiphilus stammeri]
MNYSETIVAQATPPGHGGISILRISGKKAATVAIHVLGKLPSPRLANYLSFRDIDGKTIDQGITIWFPAPNSFTGEDTLELHSHGSPIVIEMLLKCITKIPGVRFAKPGEFSERAFINDKIDLAQAEAIVDLINASSEQVARSALKSLQGRFSEHILNLIDMVTNLRIYIEASIDFPNENIDYLSNREVENKLNKIINLIEKVHTQAYQGKILREGMNVVIVGRPNAGKSSIFNALTEHDIAIVNDLPGTTRDVLRDQLNLDDVMLNIIDTAGIHQTNNVVENIGIERAWKEIKQAHHLLFIVDGSTMVDIKNLVQDSMFNELISKIPNGIELTIIRNKIDITGEVANIMQYHWMVINVSANTGDGISLIKNHLKKIFLGSQSLSLEDHFLARSRHLQALKKTQQHLEDGKIQLIKANCWDLLAEELRHAQQLLNEIIGKFVSEDLLAKIFSNFCIGK